MRVLVLQHASCEPLGEYEPALAERGAELVVVRPDAGEPLPDWRGFDALVALGGPMGACDDELHPWLAEERKLVRCAVEAGRAFLGACLGAQLLATSLGARVYPGPAPEIGVFPVSLTAAGADDPVLGGLPRRLPAAHWHGDTFDLPVGAVLLASSERYRHQAFRFGRSAYGLQFHLEVSAAMVREWPALPAYRTALTRAGGEETLRGFLAALERESDGMGAHARSVIDRWLALSAG